MTARLVTRSVRGRAALDSCHPLLRAAWDALQALPMAPGVVGYAAGHAQRDEAEQADAVRRKVSRAAFGQSPHNHEVEVSGRWVSLALDVYPIVVRGGKRVVSGSPSHYEPIGRAAATVGAEWGGAWKSFPDRPHLQVREWKALTKPEAESDE